MIRYHQSAAKLLSLVIPSGELAELNIFELLEQPQNSEHGDIAFPCFSLAKARRAAPPKIAQELAAALAAQGLPAEFQSAKAVGPYLNFQLSADAAWAFAEDAIRRQDKFGHSNLGQQKKVLIEYSSPNVAKEFHIGHFRTTILGQALCNIYRATGHNVIALNHLGDWGSQFGKVAYAFLHWGNEAELLKAPMAYLTTLYVKFHQEAETNPDLDREARLLFKKIEQGDPELRKLWQRFVDLSVDDLNNRTYKRLGVHFDHILGESFYFDKVDGLLEQLKKQNLLVESEGAQIVSLEAYDMPPCLILTGDGTTLYHTRDLAAAFYRHNTFHFDECFYVVGSEQTLHFRQLFKVLELMGLPWAAHMHHVSYGLYRFKDGKFSTRKGRVVLLQEVADEARDKVLEIIEEKNPGLVNKEEVADQVGLGALVFNDLSTDRNKDVEFDWVKILDFEGDTGPYLQYAYARSEAILRKAGEAGFKRGAFPREAALADLLANPAAASLAKLLGRLERAIAGAQRLQKPSIVANYALDLARSFNSYYRQVKVLDNTIKEETVRARLELVEASRIGLKNALGLICMDAPKAM